MTTKTEHKIAKLMDKVRKLEAKSKKNYSDRKEIANYRLNIVQLHESILEEKGLEIENDSLYHGEAIELFVVHAMFLDDLGKSFEDVGSYAPAATCYSGSGKIWKTLWLQEKSLRVTLESSLPSYKGLH